MADNPMDKSAGREEKPMTEAELIAIEQRAAALARQLRILYGARHEAVVADIERLVALVRQHLLVKDDPLQRTTVRRFFEDRGL
jgi:hypothetical protein